MNPSKHVVPRADIICAITYYSSGKTICQIMKKEDFNPDGFKYYATNSESEELWHRNIDNAQE